MSVDVDAEIDVCCTHLGDVKAADVVNGSVYLETFCKIDTDE